MSVLVVIPTVTGREIYLQRCRAAYKLTGPPGLRIATVWDRPTCGEAWNEGALLLGEERYIHFTADDLVPHAGWYEAARAVADSGFAPNPALYEWDGGRWNTGDGANGATAAFPRVPFLHRDHWLSHIRAVPPIHYYSDVYIGSVLKMCGVETLQTDDYAFTHHWASEGRHHDGGDPDLRIYNEWLERRTAE